jgi:hypothetical protein
MWAAVALEMDQVGSDGNRYCLAGQLFTCERPTGWTDEPEDATVSTWRGLLVLIVYVVSAMSFYLVR